MYIKKVNRVLVFAQQIHKPWIEWVKNNAMKISKWLSKKVNLAIVSHKWSQNDLDKDNIDWVDVHYLLELNNNKIIQFLHLFTWAFKCLFFINKFKPSTIFVQYLDTTYLLPLILVKIFHPKIRIYITIYSTDEVSIWYKRKFLRFFPFRKVIIVSDILRPKLNKLWYRNNLIQTIPLSYDKERYLDYSKFEKRDKKTILFSAWPIKEAWSFFMVDLAKKMPNFHFIFAMRQFDKKSEEEVDLLKKYIKWVWVQNITIKRNILKMEDLLSEVWAFILPLQDINIKILIPVALLEAMAKWTLTFVSNLENLIQISEGWKSIVFNRNSTDDLKQKIEENINNEKITLRAFDYSKNYPSFEEIIELYYKIIIS